jgi:repressor LexA
MELSERQQAILQYIRDFLHDNAYPPSIREIMAALGISSTSVVNYNLNALVREGAITRNKELARGIKLVDGPGSSMLRIPLMGRIVAGQPVPIPDTTAPFTDDVIELSRDIVREDEGVYALEVNGESMIDALINDGDIVVMKHQTEAHNGDMVAVWLKDEKEVTLKRFYIEGDRVRLQPANPYMSPIYTPASNVEIQGKVIMVIRQVGISRN